MIKGLKITMIVNSAIRILWGLGLIFISGKLLSLAGMENVPSFVPWYQALIGNSFIASSVFLSSRHGTR
jgi:hypothetical protein